MIVSEMIKFKKDPDHDPDSLYDSVQLIDLRQRPKQKDEEITSDKIYINYSVYLSLCTAGRPETAPEAEG